MPRLPFVGIVAVAAMIFVAAAIGGGVANA